MKGYILMFHNFGSKGDKYTVSFGKLDKILRMFKKKGFKFLRIDEINKKDQDKFFCLTFDDGYKNQLKVAEILHKKGISGTFFIITNQIGKEGYLSEEDLISMKNMGMEIGSHSCSHTNLSKLNEKEFEFELKESKKILEKIIQGKVVSFSFPGGNYTNTQLITAKKIFKNVRTSDPMTISNNNFKIYPGIGVSKKVPSKWLVNEKFIRLWNFLKMIKNSKKLAQKRDGIFHTHSTYSDGRLSLEKIAEWAKERKLKYVLMTDHAEYFDNEKYSEFIKECKWLSSGELIIVPGVEINAKNGDHIIVLDAKRLPQEDNPEEIKKWSEINNALAIIAHARIGKYYTGIRNIEIWNKKRDKGFLRIKSLNEIKKIILEHPETRFYGGTDWHGDNKGKILFSFEEFELVINKEFAQEKIIFNDGKLGIDTEGNLYGRKKDILAGVIKTEIYSLLKQTFRRIKILRDIYHKLKN